MSITKDENKHILWYIYENFQGDMYKMARSIIRDNYLAQDVVQASYERIIKKMHLIEKIPCNVLRRYTVLLVKSVAINMSKKEDKYKLEPDEDIEMLAGIEDFNLESLAIQHEQVGIVRRCLSEIDDKYALPILFRYYYGFTESETAELLDINTESTVRSLCYRGRKMIIQAMRRSGEIDE